jgi:hypothetical protein
MPESNFLLVRDYEFGYRKPVNSLERQETEIFARRMYG